jgi:hypothetical protein
MDNKLRSSASPDPARAERHKRRPYKAPVLIEYGPVAKLTQMGTGSVTDGMGGLQNVMEMCL